MIGRKTFAVALVVTLAPPAFAVEAVYLDRVPVTNPGEYLAPDNFYLQVPPPTGDFLPAETLVPASLYDINITRPQPIVAATTATATGARLASLSDDEADARSGKVRVLIKAGMDHVSDVPLAVLRDHFAESEDIELVADGEFYDYLVEVETMKPEGSPIVIMVINAYKDVGEEQLIFYNTFGYMGELKLLSSSATYAPGLESALLKEADLLAEEE